MKLAVQVFTAEVLAVALVVSLLVGGVYLRHKGERGDYTRIIALNWDLRLPSPTDEVYATNDGFDFRGEGFRYHVLQYGVSSDPGGVLPWRRGSAEELDAEALEILERLAVPSEWRPRVTRDYRWFSMTDREDGQSKIYLVWDGATRRLSVTENFF